MWAQRSYLPAGCIRDDPGHPQPILNTLVRYGPSGRSIITKRMELPGTGLKSGLALSKCPNGRLVMSHGSGIPKARLAYGKNPKNRSKWRMTGFISWKNPKIVRNGWWLGRTPISGNLQAHPPKKKANGSQMSEIPSNHGSTLGAVDSHVDHSRWQGMETWHMRDHNANQISRSSTTVDCDIYIYVHIYIYIMYVCIYIYNMYVCMYVSPEWISGCKPWENHANTFQKIWESTYDTVQGKTQGAPRDSAPLFF